MRCIAPSVWLISRRLVPGLTSSLTCVGACGPKRVVCRWPWAPFDQMPQYQKSITLDGGAATASSADVDDENPPWFPFQPPFKAKPPAGLDFVPCADHIVADIFDTESSWLFLD